MANTKMAYINKNAPPPFFAAPTGKPTKFPIPTAEPAAAKINPMRDPNCSLAPLISLPLVELLLLVYRDGDTYGDSLVASTRSIATVAGLPIRCTIP